MCSNIVNLTYWPEFTQDDLDAISHLQLRHLSMDLDALKSPTPGLVKAFSKVTHLDYLGYLDTNLDKLAHFPSLTHIAISHQINRNTVSILSETLPRLQTIVYLECTRWDDEIEVVEADQIPEAGMERVVVLRCPINCGVKTWLRDIRSSQGIWGLADEVLKERQSKTKDVKVE